MTTDVYAASPIKPKRQRLTKAGLAALDDAIVEAVELEAPVSLRGVYYRVVSAGAIDKTEAGYAKVGRRLVELRRSGRIPYGYITDGTRLTRKPKSWSGVDAMLTDAERSYKRMLWERQDAEVIIISEKEAITGTILPVTGEWDVELGVTRGYSSETFCHSIAETVAVNTWHGKTTYVYNVGDHDPSGENAWEVFQERVTDFEPDGDVEFERIAVTPAQIAEYDLMTRPTKKSDTRSARFRGESVEVDAIPPTTLRELVEAAIVQHIDEDELAITRELHERDLETLRDLRELAGDVS